MDRSPAVLPRTRGLVRRALAFVPLPSSLKVFGVPNDVTAYLLLSALLVAPTVWMTVRRRHGSPALGHGIVMRW